ncbi:hypothetical protein [Pseudomonas citronellolis]|uniref:hypothetical protein n=1 Tax=Pseudomonas citronellolis TaxID=53408 RepID=UPI00248F1AD3|nr:hypothetical protein [Pseudomonas citronellolis]
MAKTVAACRLDGVIELHDQHPGDGYFALAEGDPTELMLVIDLTAEYIDGPVWRAPGYRAIGFAWRVPGIRQGAEPRVNLDAIASYIRHLSTHNAPGVRALGV